jgi:hypothetical protein
MAAGPNLSSKFLRLIRMLTRMTKVGQTLPHQTNQHFTSRNITSVRLNYYIVSIYTSRGADKSLAFPISYFSIYSPCPRLLVNFRNKIIFYGEKLLAPRPTPKPEDHPLSAVCDCLFNIFAATFHI